MKKIITQCLLGLLLCIIFSCQKDKKSIKNETESLPFSEETNANLDIQLAIEKATLSNKKILLVFGANWCKWCKALHKFVETEEEINTKLHQTFEVVWINIGKRDKNMDIDARYGSPAANGGIPVFVILDSKGSFLTTQKTEFFEEPEEKNKPVGYDREKLLNFINGWIGTTRV